MFKWPSFYAIADYLFLSWVPQPRASWRPHCERHKEQGEKRDAAIVAQAKKRRDARRRELKGTTAQRGYGARWQALRKRFILQHPYCERCLKEGRITPATDVDHIKPHRGCPRLLFDENNLQALCHECHSRKTATEDGGFGNVKVS